MKYNKPPKTYKEQIGLLEGRGLKIVDCPHALKYLEQISYYRLSAYALPLQLVKDKFNEGTTDGNAGLMILMDNFLIENITL